MKGITPGIMPDEPSAGAPRTGGDAEPKLGEMFDDMAPSDGQEVKAQEMQELNVQGLLSPGRGRATATHSGSMERINEESSEELDRMDIDMEQRSAPAA